MRNLRRQIASLDRVARRMTRNPDSNAPDYEREAQRIAREMTEVEQARLQRDWARAQPGKPYPDFMAEQRGIVVLRRKFIAVDWMTHPREWPHGAYGTGRLLIERDSGQVWPVAGYGRPNRLYPLGNAANFTYRQEAAGMGSGTAIGRQLTALRQREGR